MYIEHPDLEPAYHNAQQYYFGDHLLVAPIVMPGIGPSRIGWQSVWFPPSEGPWYNYFTGESYAPGSEALVAADINQFPLFVRGGVPIPMQPYNGRPATAKLDHLVLRCYPGEENHTGTYTLYEDDGQTQAYKTGALAKTFFHTRERRPNHYRHFTNRREYDGQVKSRGYIN